jgi:ferric-dicitrate binding protein FerR (iron transport regulator)
MTEQYIQELIRKYAEGVASDEEIKRLMEWYRLSNVEEVQWPSSNALEKDSVYLRMHERLRKEVTPLKARIVKLSWLKVAVVLLVILGAATIMVYRSTPTKAAYSTVTNPSGKIQLINLPDGSKVWLNASTTLRYQKSFKTNRRLELDGEAYFEVTHDKATPFVVDAGGVQTTVLGTTFNIKAYKSVRMTRISVISGRVRVDNRVRELAVLPPARQLQYDRKSTIANTSSIDTNSILAWKEGRLQFQGETFSEIASAIENWYGIKVIFGNAGISTCRYYLNIDKTVSLEKFLSIMGEITELEYVFDKPRMTVKFSGEGCR